MDGPSGNRSGLSGLAGAVVLLGRLPLLPHDVRSRPLYRPFHTGHSCLCDSPIAEQLPIGAYIGIPLQRPDGSLFGTLCALHPEPMPETILAEKPMLELLARLLSAQVGLDLLQAELARRNERGSI